ncbi:GHMP family kinase ATP-binding protein [Streptococcus catagoni]|uniref:GHMP family kinase ATP-binding protein n=1 Tax=Streptococcus catagoni TaxID=2654874 RepID=UPI00140938AA|nr:kinase [Streptococcus catagoni]
MKKIRVSCPGSCGELFQGVYQGQEVLLSYNINKVSQITLSSHPKKHKLPKRKSKLRAALQLLPDLEKIRVDHKSQLPIGKGYSSSTADLASFLQAAFLYQGTFKTADEISRLCAQIEATDSVAFSDWTVINPLTGERIWQTSWKPDLYVYVLEPDVSIETDKIRRITACDSYATVESENLFPLFQEACQEESLEKLGKLATYSALLNNKRLPKPYLEEVLELVFSNQYLGINIAHSGSLIGILLKKEELASLDKFEKQIKNSPLAAYYKSRSLCQVTYQGMVNLEEVSK